MKNQVRKQPRQDMTDVILTLVFLVVFALTSGYYMLTSNTASLKVHPNDASVQNAIRASELMVEDIENGKYTAR